MSESSINSHLHKIDQPNCTYTRNTPKDESPITPFNNQPEESLLTNIDTTGQHHNQES